MSPSSWGGGVIVEGGTTITTTVPCSATAVTHAGPALGGSALIHPWELSRVSAPRQQARQQAPVGRTRGCRTPDRALQVPGTLRYPLPQIGAAAVVAQRRGQLEPDHRDIGRVDDRT